MRYPKAKKVNIDKHNPSYTIYESGGRDIENPFSGESFELLEEETEGESGGFEIDLRNASRRESGGYPKDEDEWGYNKDVKCYPFYYSKKGSPRGKGYPRETDWWQKALSFKKEVESKYNLKIVSN